MKSKSSTQKNKDNRLDHVEEELNTGYCGCAGSNKKTGAEWVNLGLRDALCLMLDLYSVK